MAEDAKRLQFRCILPDTSVGRDTYNMMQRRDISDCSFAFTCDENEWEDIQDEETNQRIGLRSIIHARLLDVSVVGSPAYPHTNVDVDTEDDYT